MEKINSPLRHEEKSFHQESGKVGNQEDQRFVLFLGFLNKFF